MAAFNYISTLRENCDPVENCGQEVCSPTITCLDIEFPATMGVEFHGDVSDPYDVNPANGPADELIVGAAFCGVNSVGDIQHHLGSELFSFFGTPIEVKYYPDLASCTWCSPESDDYSHYTTPDVDCLLEANSCEDIVVASTFCKGYIETTGADVGYEEFPNETTCYHSCCEDCDNGGSTTNTYTATAMPTLTNPRVKIETITGGLRVTVTLHMVVLGQKLITNSNRIGCGTPAEEQPDPSFCVTEYECDEVPAGDYSQVTHTCELIGYHTITATFTRDFAGATGWDDIKDQNITGTFPDEAGLSVIGTSCFIDDGPACDGENPTQNGCIPFKTSGIVYKAIRYIIENAYCVLRDVA
jgi:hypothetical protein